MSTRNYAMQRSSRLVIPLVFAVAPSAAESLEDLMRQSEAEIRHHVLAETPQGNTFEEVLETICRKKWGDPRIVKYSEYQDRGSGPQLVPLKQVFIVLKDIPAQILVVVHWSFDEHDRLIDVWVWKQQ